MPVVTRETPACRQQRVSRKCDLALLTICTSSLARAEGDEFFARTFETPGGTRLRYRLFVPKRDGHLLRFLFAREPKALNGVLGVVYRTIASHLIRQAGLTRVSGQTGAVTLIQRFGSALNLNVHLHMLFLDGAYEKTPEGLASAEHRRVAG